MVGGLLVSQALTLFTTPVVYLYLDNLSNALSRWMQSGKSDEARPGAPAKTGRKSRGGIDALRLATLCLVRPMPQPDQRAILAHHRVGRRHRTSGIVCSALR